MFVRIHITFFLKSVVRCKSAGITKVGRLAAVRINGTGLFLVYMSGPELHKKKVIEPSSSTDYYCAVKVYDSGTKTCLNYNFCMLEK